MWLQWWRSMSITVCWSILELSQSQILIWLFHSHVLSNKELKYGYVMPWCTSMLNLWQMILAASPPLPWGSFLLRIWKPSWDRSSTFDAMIKAFLQALFQIYLVLHPRSWTLVLCFFLLLNWKLPTQVANCIDMFFLQESDLWKWIRCNSLSSWHAASY